MQAAFRRSIKQAFPLILCDALAVVFSFFIALALRFDGKIPTEHLVSFWRAIPLVIFVYCLMNRFFGLYKRLWRYASVQEVLAIFASVVTSTLFVLIIEVLWNIKRPIPLSIVIAGGTFTSGAFTVVRYRKRLLTGLMGRLERVVGSPGRPFVLIIGAGEAGQLLARQLKNQDLRYQYEVVGFVDDDPKKLGMSVHGATVLGNRRQIPSLVSERAVDLIVIAMDKVSGEDFRDILSICQRTRAQIKILPELFDLMDSTSSSLLIRDVSDEDLLGRREVEIDTEACRGLISDKTVLVTGASGSIGSELCRQIASNKPRCLLLLDNNETGLYKLSLELGLDSNPWARYIVGDVTDGRKMEELFQKYRPQLIFHAAAYKHVVLMEEHPDEAVRVNIGGTMTLSELAHRYHAERFVLISTDKAVNPCSVMGAAKRVGELLTSSMPSNGQTLYTAVRFGNVLGSRGSVIPTFQKQIEMGRPVTVTHPDAARFFMSAQEAVNLIIQAASLTRGGDIFILDMGEEIKIDDLARKMIRLRGLRVGEDIEIKYIGLRPGEKLHEELVSKGEEKHPTAHPSIFHIENNDEIDRDALLAGIEELMSLTKEANSGELVTLLQEMVRTHAWLDFGRRLVVRIQPVPILEAK